MMRTLGSANHFASLDGPGIYDRKKVVKLLDAVPSMDGAARNRIDSVLMWMSSICLLHERLGISDAGDSRTVDVERPLRRLAS